MSIFACSLEEAARLNYGDPMVKAGWLGYDLMGMVGRRRDARVSVVRRRGGRPSRYVRRLKSAPRARARGVNATSA
jgi:hypothetical protein